MNLCTTRLSLCFALAAFAGTAIAKPASTSPAAPVQPAAPTTTPIKIEPLPGPPTFKPAQPGQPGAAQPGQPAGTGQPGQPAKPFELPARMQPPPPPPPFVKPEMPTITATDPDVQAVIGKLVGNFKAPASGDQPARLLHGAVIKVDGLDNAVYFELTREDSPMTSYRSGVFTVYKQTPPGGTGATLVLRVLDFDKFAPTFSQAVTGLWLAPEYFPAVKTTQLRVVQDINLTNNGGTLTGVTASAPTMMGGATVFRTAISLADGKISWSDTGFDKDGKVVFGPKEGTAADTFSPAPVTTKVSKNDENGLVVIDFREGEKDAPPAVDGFEMYFHYTGWTAADGNQFDSSRERDPIKMALPGNLIAGWNLGMPGVKQGGFRKLVIPGALGYGTRGNPRAKIPPMATLIFETECVSAKMGETPKPVAPPAPAPGSAGVPAGQPGSATPPPVEVKPQMNPAEQPK